MFAADKNPSDESESSTHFFGINKSIKGLQQ